MPKDLIDHSHRPSKLLMLMAAYVLHTMPGIKSINIDVTGDMNETDLVMEHESVKPLGPIFN